jgi:hypothetical protein
MLKAVTGINSTVAQRRNLEIQELLSIIDILLLRANQSTGTPSQHVSGADELAKYKKLLDDGTITQDEFNAKKRQILGL